ncbi:DUF1674 domain-containing protein [Oceanicaulis sp. MMSF_3324]|uniref:DUF1674 domain-containing protein n=1 Tax=Oceanicaulis sp. MMSF_3324 TaxID=3046702 RepID=UPI00273E4033|nr:DUF1674 domain-containing protein [Oceanicaulis sp. MMSF_3324]
MSDEQAPEPDEPRKPLSEAAKRALAEAEERRRKAEEEAAREKELGGPKGPEPTRFGDWEKKGITYDF